MDLNVGVAMGFVLGFAVASLFWTVLHLIARKL